MLSSEVLLLFGVFFCLPCSRSWLACFICFVCFVSSALSFFCAKACFDRQYCCSSAFADSFAIFDWLGVCCFFRRPHFFQFFVLGYPVGGSCRLLSLVLLLRWYRLFRCFRSCFVVAFGLLIVCFHSVVLVLRIRICIFPIVSAPSIISQLIVLACRVHGRIDLVSLLLLADRCSVLGFPAVGLWLLEFSQRFRLHLVRGCPVGGFCLLLLLVLFLLLHRLPSQFPLCLFLSSDCLWLVVLLCVVLVLCIMLLLVFVVGFWVCPRFLLHPSYFQVIALACLVRGGIVRVSSLLLASG